MLKFEVPYTIDNKGIENLLDTLNPITIEGYPYALKKAHNDVVIKTKDMKQLIKIIGINEKKNRKRNAIKKLNLCFFETNIPLFFSENILIH